MTADGSYRQERKVAARDQDFSVRIASIDELCVINQEDQARHWSARWSSEQVLRHEVASGSTVVLCPLFRNGGHISEPESYRCHVFFAGSSGNRAHVSLIDVSRDAFERLRRVESREQFERIVRLMVDSYDLTTLG